MGFDRYAKKADRSAKDVQTIADQVEREENVDQTEREPAHLAVLMDKEKVDQLE